MMSTPQTSTRTRWLLATALTLGLPAYGQEADAPDAPAIDGARSTLQEWVDVRKTIANTKYEWAQAKEIMLGRIDLMKEEIEEIKTEIQKQKETLAGFDTSIEELEAKNEKLKQASEKLERLVEQMEARTLALLEKVPTPLAEQVKPLAVQLPGYGGEGKPVEEKPGDVAESGSDAEVGGEEKESKVPLARRAENVVGVLYMVNKFTGKIEQTSELVDLADGTSLSVDTVYLGLSYGYYVDDTDKKGAGGWGGPDGWAWNPLEKPDAAALIRQAISVYNKDEPAAFVGLPVEVQE